jgi:hypothetical protein
MSDDAATALCGEGDALLRGGLRPSEQRADWPVAIASREDRSGRRNAAVVTVPRGTRCAGFERGRDLEAFGQLAQETSRSSSSVTCGSRRTTSAGGRGAASRRLVLNMPDERMSMVEYPIARNVVNARAGHVYGGTIEIMRDLIGRSIRLGAR